MPQVIPLSSDGARRVTVDLGDGIGLFTFRSRYNTVVTSWYLDIYDSAGKVLAYGLGLVPAHNILRHMPKLSRAVGQLRVVGIDDASTQGADSLGASFGLVHYAPSEFEALYPEGVSNTATAVTGRALGYEFGSLVAAWSELAIPSLLSWLDVGGVATITEDVGGVAQVSDASGQENDAVQTSQFRRMALATLPRRLVPDEVDDNMAIDFTGQGGIEGTLVQGGTGGTFIALINIPDGLWEFVRWPDRFPLSDLTGIIISGGVMSDFDSSRAVSSLRANGAGVGLTGVSDISYWFDGRADIVRLYVADWDVSGVTTAVGFCRDCNNLAELDVADWDVSNVVNFTDFIGDCTQIAALDVSNWDVSSAVDFLGFAYDCEQITELDLSNWNAPNATSFALLARGCISLTTVKVAAANFAGSACTDFENAFTNTNLSLESITDILVAIDNSGESSGTFNQSGGASPNGAVGLAAIASLRARGWTISVTGGI